MKGRECDQTRQEQLARLSEREQIIEGVVLHPAELRLIEFEAGGGDVFATKEIDQKEI